MRLMGELWQDDETNGTGTDIRRHALVLPATIGDWGYHRRDVTAEGELAKVIDYVASVHLKDTTGGYECWDFPALGAGVVDFPKVLSMLADRQFAGPLTMELEGTEGVKLDEDAQLKYVEDSAAYLRGIGAFD